MRPEAQEQDQFRRVRSEAWKAALPLLSIGGAFHVAAVGAAVAGSALTGSLFGMGVFALVIAAGAGVDRARAVQGQIEDTSE